MNAVQFLSFLLLPNLTKLKCAFLLICTNFGQVLIVFGETKTSKRRVWQVCSSSWILFQLAATVCGGDILARASLNRNLQENRPSHARVENGRNCIHGELLYSFYVPFFLRYCKLFFLLMNIFAKLQKRVFLSNLKFTFQILYSFFYFVLQGSNLYTITY